MGHVPHFFVARPWESQTIGLTPDQRQHLKVLRLPLGASLTYTDGHGTVGTGVLGEGGLERGEETLLDRLPELELVVAPPHERERVRWLVEKAAELEVWRVRWLRTRYVNARPRTLERSVQWAIGALEQSRGSWLLAVESDWVNLDELPLTLPTVVADRGGDPLRATLPLRVIVGPEGGWAPGELEPAWPRVSLGRSVLRTETAAVVAAARLREERVDD